MLTAHFVTVRKEGWTARVPAVLISDGTLAFAAGNVETPKKDDEILPALAWTEREWLTMHRDTETW